MKNDEIGEDTPPADERDLSAQNPDEDPAEEGAPVPQPEEDDEEEEEESSPAEDASSDEEAIGNAAFAEDAVPTTAYDLDHGRPIQTSRGGGLPWMSKVKSAKEFFNAEILYRFDIMEPQDRTPLNGAYRIELKGYRGGVWTVSIGNDLSVVNRREEADVTLTMHQRDFLGLVNGEINPQLAILAQKIRVTGDVRRASLFQALLYPSGE